MTSNPCGFRVTDGWQDDPGRQERESPAVASEYAWLGKTRGATIVISRTTKSEATVVMIHVFPS